MNLLERKEDIFKVAEPHLVAIARQFNLHDPQGEARSWFFRFQKILEGFDAGRYDKRYKSKSGERMLLPEIPSEEQMALFYRSLVAYLKQAYKNELRAQYRKQKRVHLIADYEADVKPDMVAVQGNLSSLEHSHEEVIGLIDMIKIISEDIIREELLATVARDRLNVLFLKSIGKFYDDMFEKYGNFSIVRNLHAKNSRDFFIYDIRDGRTNRIGLELAVLIGKEPVRSVVLQSRKLLAEKSGYYALNRKISRYFNDEHDGMPLRLKRAKKIGEVL